MTLLEFLDRWMERRARNPRPQRDIRQFIGFAFLAGYYVIVWKFIRDAIPVANIGLVRDAMLTLGPPVGLIVGAMFRSDAREDQATVNTGKVIDMASAAVANSTPDGTLRSGDQFTVTKAD